MWLAACDFPGQLTGESARRYTVTAAMMSSDQRMTRSRNCAGKPAT
ncbi:hypothetical protein OG488_36480 [Streptomyces sp. NBC_01460]|nr:hypothetical protein [Streptomyces sp. NBC_01460]